MTHTCPNNGCGEPMVFNPRTPTPLPGEEAESPFYCPKCNPEAANDTRSPPVVPFNASDEPAEDFARDVETRLAQLRAAARRADYVQKVEQEAAKRLREETAEPPERVGR